MAPKLHASLDETVAIDFIVHKTVHRNAHVCTISDLTGDCQPQCIDLKQNSILFSSGRKTKTDATWFNIAFHDANDIVRVSSFSSIERLDFD